MWPGRRFWDIIPHEAPASIWGAWEEPPKKRCGKGVIPVGKKQKKKQKKKKSRHTFLYRATALILKLLIALTRALRR